MSGIRPFVITLDSKDEVINDFLGELVSEKYQGKIIKIENILEKTVSQMSRYNSPAELQNSKKFPQTETIYSYKTKIQYEALKKVNYQKP